MGSAQKNALKYMIAAAILCGLAACNGVAPAQQAPGKDTPAKYSDTVAANPIPMKRFDIARYEQKIKADPEYEGYAPDKDHFIWEAYIPDPAYLDEGYNQALIAGYARTEEDRWEAIKETSEFDREGRLKATRTYFNDYLEVGIWRRWNVQGQMIEETDKDKPYPFTLRQVLDFAGQKGADLRTTGSVKRDYDTTLKQYVWRLTWVAEHNGRSYEQYYLLDGVSGKILQQRQGPAPGFIPSR